MSFLDKIFGNPEKKYLDKFLPLVERINSLEKEFRQLADEKLKEKTLEFKERLKKGETLDDLLPEAFALVRESSKRTLGQRHFDVQLMGGMALHQGRIAEMKTGEGKTLASTLALYLNALEGKGVHLVTVNDYLAKRDCAWMGQIYDLLGLTVGCITHEASFLYNSGQQEKDKERDIVGGFKVVEDFLRPASRKGAYLADITYGTNNEFGFDYLRDNMSYTLENKVQRGFNFAVIDEIDSILIDEARTPLIISGSTGESTDKYYQFSKLAQGLKEKIDYEIDEKLKTASFTEEGQKKAIKALGNDPWLENDISTTHHLEAALRAKTLFLKDRDYVVKNNDVLIVDEFTGRIMPGRRWSAGLHQAIEAKEGVKVQEESKTFATITFQNYFRLYKKLAGMTGTALTSAEEFDKVYKLEAVSIPTHKPMIRENLADKIYKTEDAKFKAVAKEIKKRSGSGQPVLVGTISIEKNEHLGRLLDLEGVPHKILNAKNHEKEGEIIAQAGKLGSVTIATNMAGRGVDIILGGNPPDLEEQKKVVELGGLCVIGTERHEARRIDDQLRGRSGRQGDPGSSQFFVSFEDDLMRIFGGDKMKSLMETMKIPDDQPIEMKMVSRMIESAQEKVEGMNFDLRKHILEYDDVMNRHREVFYKKRDEILGQKDFMNFLINIFEKAGNNKEDFEKKEKEVGKEKMLEIGKIVCLRVCDEFWLEHLENMEHLRDSVRLRAYGQQDPLVEYKTEGHRMFKKLLIDIDSSIANSLMQIKIQTQPAFASPESRVSRGTEAGQDPKFKNVGRNDLCPCGSGKKFKKCHGK
jgi:preprotein translocase subunit SecA